MSRPQRWLVAPEPRPGARVRLVCFPHAGGGSAAFHAWARCAPAHVEVWAAQLPGREMRFREPPVARLPDLADALAAALDALPGDGGRAPVLYGHSMGALLAFEVARGLRRVGRAAPAGLLLAGSAPPEPPGPQSVSSDDSRHDAPDEPSRHSSHGPPSGALHRLPEPEFLRAVRSLGGFPPGLLDDVRIRDHVLPMMRADLAAVETYRCRPEPPFDVPVTVFYGTEDTIAPGAAVRRWARHTTGPFRAVAWPGGHFHPLTHRDRFLTLLLPELATVTGMTA